MQKPEQAKIVTNQSYPDRRGAKAPSAMQRAINSPHYSVSARHLAPLVRAVGIYDELDEQQDDRALKDADLLQVLLRQYEGLSLVWLVHAGMMEAGRAPGDVLEQAS